MSYTAHWKGSSGKAQKPSKGEPSTATNAPGSPMDNSWTLMNADDASPPTPPGVGPQAGPAQTSAHSSITDATQYPEDADVKEVAIAVMGATGTGKSTFINLVSGANFSVGNGLRSCTNAVQIAGAFDLDGRRVVLIDTPGFDDTTLSETDVLNMIAVFLATSYERGNMLAGVLYFHRISDFRVGGISRKNFNMFRKLCGDSALQNVVIVTNRWEEVDPQVGDAREAELANEDIFFKPILDKGARMARHQNTAPSAETIIRLILDNHPLPLRIQEELVSEHKDISETGAGEELNRELNAQIRRYKEEMHALREEMRVLRVNVDQAMKDEDEETRRELKIEAKSMQKVIERLQNDSERLVSDYRIEKERLEARIEQIEMRARQEADRVAVQHQRQMDELRGALQSNAATSEREKAQIIQHINDLSRGSARAQANGPVGFFSMIGAILDTLIPMIIR